MSKHNYLEFSSRIPKDHWLFIWYAGDYTPAIKIISQKHIDEFVSETNGFDCEEIEHISSMQKGDIWSLPGIRIFKF
jgi:hypothetical protein